MDLSGESICFPPPLAAERRVDAESQCSCLKGPGRGRSSESSNSAVKSESEDKGSGREISKLSLSPCVRMSSLFGTVPRGFKESAGALAPISKIRQFPETLMKKTLMCFMIVKVYC